MSRLALHRALARAASALLLALLCAQAPAATFLEQLQQQSPEKRTKEAKGDASLYAPERIPADVAPFIDANQLLVSDAASLALLDDIATQLLAHWPRDKPQIRFYLRAADEYDASANPGGIILVTTGLLQKAENEAELAAVIAHELSHHLIGHLRGREARAPVPFSFEIAGLALAAVDLWRNRDTGGRAKLGNKGVESLMWSMTASTIWGDLLSRSWDRGQESDADKLGCDLMRKAGYPTTAFRGMFKRVTNQQGGRAQRLALLRNGVQAGAQAALAKRFGGDSLEGVVTQMVATTLLDKLFGGLSKLNAEYRPSEIRSQELEAYQAAEYTERVDKVAKPQGRLEALRAGSFLQADAKAFEAWKMMNAGDMRAAAKYIAEARQIGGADQPLTIVIDMMLARATGDRARELSLTEHWTQNEYAPAGAFLQLAELQARNRNVDAALDTLQRGTFHVGRDYQFLPFQVLYTKRAGLGDAAQMLSMKCRQSQGREETNLFRALGESGHLYQVCSQVIGRDVMVDAQNYHATRNQKTQAEHAPSNNPLADALDTLTRSASPLAPPKRSVVPVAGLSLDMVRETRWAGRLDLVDLDTPLEVRLRVDNEGKPLGKLELRGMGCEVSLQLSEAAKDSITFTTQIDKGAWVCPGDTLLKFYLLADGSLYMQQLRKDEKKKKMRVIAGALLRRA